MAFLLGYLGAAAGVAFLLSILLRTGLAWRIATDRPNHRSLHDLPVPRVGGWGLVPVWTAVCWLTAASLPWLPWLVLLLAAVSYADDRSGLSPAFRFSAHCLAAATAVLCIPTQSPLWMAAIGAAAMVWMTNLFNFMDGSDGMAGGMALFGFAGYATLAWKAGDAKLAMMALAASGAALGFLCFNFHPARVFLGDAGSIPCGFLAGALGWMGMAHGVWPWWLPLFMFSPFLVDATVTLLRRALRGEKVWLAHREHYYQRLVRMGFGHRNTALAYYGLMFGVVVSGIALAGSDPLRQILGIAAWAMIFALAAGYVDRRWSRFATGKAAC